MMRWEKIKQSITAINGHLQDVENVHAIIGYMENHHDVHIYNNEQSTLHGSSLSELKELSSNINSFIPALKEAKERLQGELVKSEAYLERFPGDAVVFCAAAAYASAWPHFIRDNFVKSIINMISKSNLAVSGLEENDEKNGMSVMGALAQKVQVRVWCGPEEKGNLPKHRSIIDAAALLLCGTGWHVVIDGSRTSVEWLIKNHKLASSSNSVTEVKASELSLARIKLLAASSGTAEKLLIVTSCELGLHPEFALFLGSRKDFIYNKGADDSASENEDDDTDVASDVNSMDTPVHNLSGSNTAGKAITSPNISPMQSPTPLTRKIAGPKAVIFEDEDDKENEFIEHERRRSSLLSAIANYDSFAENTSNENFNFPKAPHKQKSSSRNHENAKSTETTIRVFIFGDEQDAVKIPCTLKICLLFSDHNSMERVLPESAMDNLQICNFSSGWRRDVKRDLYNYVYEEEADFASKLANSERKKAAHQRRKSSLTNSTTRKQRRRSKSSTSPISDGNGGGDENGDYILSGKFFTKTTANIVIAREKVNDAIFRLKSIDEEMSAFKTHQAIVSNSLEIDNITNRLIIELTKTMSEVS